MGTNIICFQNNEFTFLFIVGEFLVAFCFCFQNDFLNPFIKKNNPIIGMVYEMTYFKNKQGYIIECLVKE